MAKNTILINDFRAGEITPVADARVDTKAYYRGCRILENAMPIIEGGAARVPGTYYVRPVKTDEGWNIRVTKSGTGTGVVTSDIVGIDCGSSCYVFFVDGVTVVLTATPDSGMSFEAWSGDGTGLVTRSVLMNGNKVVNAEFSAIPQNNYLIGWYKFNEGSGLIVNNYATDGSGGGGLLPSLGIVSLNTFWSANTGFGTKSASMTQDFAWNKPNRTIGNNLGWAYGRFLKMPVSGGVATRGGDIITAGIQACIQTVPASGTETNSNGNNGTGGVTVTVAYLGVWLFHFIASDGVYRVCKPDGTLVVGGALPGGMAGTINLNYILMGFQYADADPPTIVLGTNPTVFGDWILYSKKLLTVSEWATWYDKLRSRHGMAARSGW